MANWDEPKFDAEGWKRRMRAVLDFYFHELTRETLPVGRAMDDLQFDVLVTTLAHTDGSVTRSAKLLGIGKRRMQDLMRAKPFLREFAAAARKTASASQNFGTSGDTGPFPNSQ